MKFLKFVGSSLIVFAAAFIGNIATTTSSNQWYDALDKPHLNPPSSVFGPVWSVLYLFIAVSLFFIWIIDSPQSKTRAYILFGVQLILNALWSIVFFGFENTWGGVVVIALLVIAIIATMLEFRRFSVFAFYILIPYLLWVIFATYLNLSIAILNS